jgi:hypothetical protein
MQNPIDEVPDGQIAIPGEGYVAPSVVQIQVAQIERLDQAQAKKLLDAVQAAIDKAVANGQLIPGIVSIVSTIAKVVIGR